MLSLVPRYYKNGVRSVREILERRKRERGSDDDEEYREIKNDHPPLDPDSEEWRRIAGANAKDMELCVYIQELCTSKGSLAGKEEEDHHLMCGRQKKMK